MRRRCSKKGKAGKVQFSERAGEKNGAKQPSGKAEAAGACTCPPVEKSADLSWAAKNNFADVCMVGCRMAVLSAYF